MAIAGEISVSQLIDQLGQQIPSFKTLFQQIPFSVAVNQEIASKQTMIQDGDEVAFLPPFSGGEEIGRSVRISEEDFSIEAEVKNVVAQSTRIGGVVTFLGTARDFSNGKPVSKLTFEHYPGMAENQLSEIRRQAIEKFNVLAMTILHRTGTIQMGENIVLVVAGAEHRKAAFLACSWAIDELKRTVPIWKRETTPQGESWVTNHP